MKADPCVYLRHGKEDLIVLIYVVDILVISKDLEEISRFGPELSDLLFGNGFCQERRRNFYSLEDMHHRYPLTIRDERMQPCVNPFGCWNEARQKRRVV